MLPLCKSVHPESQGDLGVSVRVTDGIKTPGSWLHPHLCVTYCVTFPPFLFLSFFCLSPVLFLHTALTLVSSGYLSMEFPILSDLTEPIRALTSRLYFTKISTSSLSCPVCRCHFNFLMPCCLQLSVPCVPPWNPHLSEGDMWIFVLRWHLLWSDRSCKPRCFMFYTLPTFRVERIPACTGLEAWHSGEVTECKGSND